MMDKLKSRKNDLKPQHNQSIFNKPLPAHFCPTDIQLVYTFDCDCNINVFLLKKASLVVFICAVELHWCPKTDKRISMSHKYHWNIDLRYQTSSSVFRSDSCEDRSQPPGSAVEEVPPTRISVWPAPPPPRGTTWAQTRTSSPARCLPTPFTPPCLSHVTRLPASTARAAQTARQRSGCGHIRTPSSCMAAWCAPRRWITESRRRCGKFRWISLTLKDAGALQDRTATVNGDCIIQSSPPPRPPVLTFYLIQT